MKRFERDLVKGWLYEPASPNRDAIAITHGAGGDCETPLLRALADEFSAAGLIVLRYDLPYRQSRPKGSPFPAGAARDREGVRAASLALREMTKGKIYLAGHSYGGRQTSMLAAEDASVADALLLLSYPLHPPGKPNQPRTDHFGKLRVPALFVHGTRDAFGSIDELQTALPLIPARTELMVAQGAPHGVPPKVAPEVASRFVTFASR